MPDLEIPESTGPSARTLKRTGLVVAVAALGVVAFGVASRLQATGALEASAADAGVTTVSVVHPAKPGDSDGLVLPGQVQAFNSAAIFARTNGYVRSWQADIGQRVAAGQTLAVLDAPELDQQLASARADYQTALANQRLAATTATRWKSMLGQDAVSQQEADEKAGDYAAKTALANAALANVRQLAAMHGFTHLSAPFAGVVTSRSAQIGALVVANNAAALPLFTVSDVHRMRIYVQVPQSYAAQVRGRLSATLTLPEYPGRSFNAVLIRSSGAVDPKSGAQLVELQADNPDGALMPGAFAQVHFAIPGAAGGLAIPGSAILTGDKGSSVVVVGSDGRVTIRPVTIARDLGATVVVAGGLSPTDNVVDTPPDSIQSGDRVKVATPAPSKAKGAAS
ncbi:efflux RND transporter periplasmic adaptor subunit [Novosphingobium flavum]|uniref:Efflux RND transporter periplasmic adaptor subunit n=1 Tax=Novosphingobium flavum TaxID=1778672 RepID=A0A7X1KLZ1_9SPHN|nr:efflux RND transporter periplasmic adaptor subunit [Novosphingobium flavum]MBC2666086.1 efflux RND transporter periplasmic adaptor subunit [Novosphingobium flavum]